MNNVKDIAKVIFNTFNFKRVPRKELVQKPGEADKMLQESEEKYRMLFESVNDAIMISELAENGKLGKFIQVNDVACKRLGYTREEMLSKTPFDINSEKAKQSLATKISNIIEEKHAIVETEHVTKDGKVIPVEINTRVSHFQNKTIFISVARDITERKRAEIRLRDEKERIRSILDLVGDPIFVKDSEHRITLANRAFYDIFCLDEKSVIGYTLVEAVPENERHHFLKVDRSVLDTGIPDLREEELTVKDITKNIITRKMRFIDESGNRFLVGSIHDISERKQAEEILRESEMRFRSLFEHMLNGFAYCQMLYKDAKPIDFIYLNVNKAFESLTGLKNVEGKRVTEVIPGIRESDDQLFEIYGRVALTGQPETIEMYIQALRDWYFISVYSPKVGFFIAVFDVITERKQAELALRASENRFRIASESLLDVVYEWDLKDKVDWFGDIDGIMGYPVNSFPRTLSGWATLLHPEDLQKVMEAIQGQLKKSEPYTIEYRVMNKAGNWRWWSARGTAVRDKNNIPYSWIGSITDITIGKLEEETLRESERKLREVQEMAHLGFWSWDIKTGNVEWSEEVYKIFSLDPKEFKPQIDSILKLSPWPEDQQRDTELINHAIKTRTPGFYEQKFLHPDQSIGYYYSTFQGKYDVNGNLISIVGTALDITERKIAEIALRESEAKFRKLLESLPLPLCYVNKNGLMSFRNERFVKVFGYSEIEVPGIDEWWLKAYPNEEYRREVIQNWDSAVERAAKSGTDIESELYHITCKDGTVREIIISGITIKDDLLATFIDLTERIKAEEEIRNNEKRFKELIESLPQLFWTTRVDGPCDYLSKQWIEYTGVPESEQLGYGWLEQLHPEDRERTVSDWMEKVKTGDSFDIEFRIRRNDGIYHWFKTRAVPMRDINGNITKWFGSNTDFDDTKRAEYEIIKLNETLEHRILIRTEQLETANKELEAFSYSVSHDLRAPLRGINGFVQILMDDYGSRLDDEAKRICTVIMENSHKMGHLIDDLLAFSRLGRTEMQLSVVDMKTMVNSMYYELTDAISRKRIDLRIDDISSLNGDPTLLRQVWANLLSNAIKYSSKKEKAEISVSCKKEKNQCVYCIRDNGVGFDMKYADKLFGVFQRLHSTKEFEGTGVGLAIVQRIIRRHGGDVRAEGEIDKGAAFYFSLPIIND